jgi:precorrin-8X/cobalt-precorrin-8 methylmutase
MNPEAIEAKSFRIVLEGLHKKGQEGLLQGPKGAILARVIHATADFSFADTLLISGGAAEKGVLALQQGSPIIVDVEMVRAGINKKGLQDLGGVVCCFIADEDVAKEAKSLGITRASVAMQKAARLFPKAIYAVGNAPTALLELFRLTLEGKARPSLVIGVPVGFVMAAESKEQALALPTLGVPVITARGPKGGSSVAVAVLNAMIRLALEKGRGDAPQGQA